MYEHSRQADWFSAGMVLVTLAVVVMVAAAAGLLVNPQ